MGIVTRSAGDPVVRWVNSVLSMRLSGCALPSRLMIPPSRALLAARRREASGSRLMGRWIDPLAGAFDKNDETKVQDFVARMCKGRIYEVLPGQLLDEKIGDLVRAAKRGDADARTCLKLLSRPEYRSECRRE